LSNRVHPQAKSNINRLRGQVATIVAASIVAPPFPTPQSETSSSPRSRSQSPALEQAQPEVLTGIDLLKHDGFRPLRGRRLGLVSNHSGVDRQGNRTIDLLCQASEVTLVAIFSPEHGIAGRADSAVADAKDEKTGLPIYSLFGKSQRPSAEQLRDIDTLV